jgi:hypothetical protein
MLTSHDYCSNEPDFAEYEMEQKASVLAQLSLPVLPQHVCRPNGHLKVETDDVERPGRHPQASQVHEAEHVRDAGGS